MRTILVSQDVSTKPRVLCSDDKHTPSDHLHEICISLQRHENLIGRDWFAFVDGADAKVDWVERRQGR